MLALPSVTKQAANEGLQLWIFTVLPALLPYSIISSILMQLNAFAVPCKLIGHLIKRNIPENEIFIIICGCLCGCPIGAKIASDSYKSGKISKNTATFLMCAFNNISPSFLINYIFIEIYTPFINLSLMDKWILYIIMITSTSIGASIVSYLTIKPNKKKSQKHFYQSNNTLHIMQTIVKDTNSLYSTKDFIYQTNIFTFSKSIFMDIFDKCILSAFEMQVKIGGYIILFNIINKIFLYTSNMPWLHSSIFGSFMELTSGLGLFLHPSRQISNISYVFIPAIISSLTTFGGLCTICQTKTVISDTDLSIFSYTLSKFIACIFSFLLTITFFSLR